MGTTANTATTWRFGVFEFDAPCGELRRAGVPIKLRDQSSRILVYLLEHAGQMVTREELRQHLWPSDTFVDFDHSLNTAIMKLREALGDSADKPLYIETVPKRGYRFVAPVSLGLAVETRNGPPRRPGPALADLEETPADANGKEDGGDAATGDTTRHWWLLSGLIAAALVILATGFLVHRAVRNRNASGRAVQPDTAAAASSRMRIVPLTSLPGTVRDPVFSPDGEKIAFIWDGENPVRGDLYVQLVGGEKPLRLTHTGSGFTCCADWSRDGRQIAFGRCDDNGGGIFIVPALGGTERKLTDVICPLGDAGHPKWIADGKSLLLIDRCEPDGPSGIVAFSLETGEKRCLSHPPLSGWPGDSFPALSPDGRTVAFVRSSTAGTRELYTVALSGGNLHQITHEGTAGLNFMWSSDGQHIVFNSGRSGLFRVWRVAAAGGDVKLETVYPGSGTLSRDGSRLAYVDPPGILGRSVAISRLELSGAGGQIVSQNKILATDGGNTAPQLSPDGRQIVFESCRTGRCQIWRSDADGSSPLQMTFFDNGFPGTPRWSPDGKWVAFDHHPDRHSQIYLIDSEGRNLHAVTSGNHVNVVPSWSRDGTALYFASNRTGTWQVWKRELSTGREAQLTRHGGFAVFESYDGKELYYSKFERGGIWSIPVSGGEEQQVTEALHLGYWGYFAVTEKGIYLLDSDAAPKPTLMFYNFQTHQLGPLLRLAEAPVPWSANLAASRDGRTVFIAQGAQHSSITMVENFQ
jgi:Tol biopolymer transport system component/DNA-binding winged helix-turn-helix (wHTH) protein